MLATITAMQCCVALRFFGRGDRSVKRTRNWVNILLTVYEMERGFLEA